MCDFISDQNDLPIFFLEYPSIVTTYQKFHYNTKNAYPTISFHVYGIVSRFTVHGGCHIEEKVTCVLCSTVLPAYSNIEIYSQKELVIMESSIYDFRKKFCTPEIKS